MPSLPHRCFRLLAGTALLMLAGGVLHAVAADRARDGGAGGHWAFQPLRRPAVPATPAGARADSPVDAFLLGPLSKRGLAFSPPAPDATVARRAAFVLTGLPPRVEDLEAMDRAREAGRPGVLEVYVDKLLAEVSVGERWGKHWLDAAGYADSNGYFSADTDRPLAHRYRDYVIRAFNRDLPQDRFCREQLAGDELADWSPGLPATDDIIELLEATHFLRNGQDGTGESDGNPDEVRVDRYHALDSSLQILGSCLLGLTVQCAKCHDHKFEPLTQRDYYGLQAVLYPAFNVEQWLKPSDRVVEANPAGVLEAWLEREKVVVAELEALDQRFAAEQAGRRPLASILFQDPFDEPSRLGEHWSGTAPGDLGPSGMPAVQLDTNVPPAALVKDGILQIIEGGGSGDRCLSTRRSFSWKPAGLGDWIQATFDLVRLHTGAPTVPAERIGYLIAVGDFDDSRGRSGGNILIDGNPAGGASVHVDYPGADRSGRGRIGVSRYMAGRNFGVRITNRGSNTFALEQVVDGIPEAPSLMLEAGDLPDGAFGFEYCCGRSFEVDHVRIETWSTNQTAFAEAEAAYRRDAATRRQSYEASRQRIESGRTPRPGAIAWVSDRGTNEPGVRLLLRGNPKTPGEAVVAGPPSFLGAATSSAAGEAAARRGTGRRLRLAQWLTARGSPQEGLVARVLVNRVWQHHFGRGIAETVENLGRSGSPPTHPELLEWLACELVDNGWRLKPLQRRILNSAAFRQSSEAQAAGLAADESNHLLWRYPMRRLDAEAIRDSMLCLAGHASPKRGGAYVPTQRTAAGEIVVDESRPDAGARSVYLQMRRTQVPTLLGVFDAPSVVFNCTRRPVTTMPLQSLSLLNSEFALRRAAGFAGRLVGGHPDVPARLEAAFRAVASRRPTEAEARTCLAFLDRQGSLHRRKEPPGEAEVRAWADLCQMLFASSAFLYLE